MVVDARHAVWYRDARQTCAVFKRTTVNTRHAVGNGDLHQIFAVFKRTGANARNARGKCYTRAGIVRKDLLIDGRHVWRCHPYNGGRTTLKRILAHVRHAVRQHDIGQCRAIAERIFVDTRKPVRQHEVGQVTAAGKRVRADLPDAVGQRHGFESRAAHKGVPFDFLNTRRDRDAPQTRAAVKRIVLDLCHADADLDLPQRGAVLEHKRHDLFHAAADHGGFKPRAALKRFVADRRHAVGYRDRRQFRATGKSMRTDALRALRQRHGNKVRTPFEHVIVDLGHAAEDRHVGQRRALPKSGRTYVRHGAPDRNVRQFLALIERRRRDDLGVCVGNASRNIPVKGAYQNQARVFLVAEVKGVIKDIAEQGGTAHDRVHMHAGHVVSERNLRQPAAHAKRPVGNVTARHRDRRQRRGQHVIDGPCRLVAEASVLRRVNAGVVVLCSEDGAERVLHFTLVGRVRFDTHKGQRDMHKARTAGKSSLGNTGNTVRHHHVHKTPAPVKRITLYVGDTRGKSDIR